MAKDPAVLWYTSDFLTGTMTMTDDQVGKYTRLLCVQHQQGHLSEEDMLNICKTYDKKIYKKFAKDENGNFYNKRMDFEINRRKMYSESRSKNRSGKGKKKKKICETYDKHMENENINIIITYLNTKANKNYKSNTQKTITLINARAKEGFTVENFKKVIDNKVKDWLNDPNMNEYLRPETLFGTKFEGYLNKTINERKVMI